MAEPGHEGLGKTAGKEMAGGVALGQFRGVAKELGRMTKGRLGGGDITLAHQQVGAGQEGAPGFLDGNKLGEIRLATAAGQCLAIALTAAGWALHDQDSM